MPETITVKPAPGLVVRDPATRQALPAEGAEVPRNTYWMRRLRDGDVIEAQAAVKAASKTK